MSVQTKSVSPIKCHVAREPDVMLAAATNVEGARAPSRAALKQTSSRRYDDDAMDAFYDCHSTEDDFDEDTEDEAENAQWIALRMMRVLQKGRMKRERLQERSETTRINVP